MTKRKTPDPSKEKEAHVEIASTKDVPNAREKKLLEEIRELRAQVAEKSDQLTAAEAGALALAESQGMLMQREIREVPTGKTITVQRLAKYKTVGHKDDGRPILAPTWKNVVLPTFFYRVDLPPSGGTDLKINDVPLYHGAVYTLDEDSLRTVKDLVYRCWKHDADINGSNENAYRRPNSPTLRGGARA